MMPFMKCLVARDEAFVISWGYGMGEPLTPSQAEGNREGEGLPAYTLISLI